MQLYCMPLARLEAAGRMSDTIAGLAKLNNPRKARWVISEGRDLLGGNGILLENHVMRHMADIEAIHTFEARSRTASVIAQAERVAWRCRLVLRVAPARAARPAHVPNHQECMTPGHLAVSQDALHE